MQASNASGDRRVKRVESCPEDVEDRDRLDEDLANLYEAYGDAPSSEETRGLADKLKTAVDAVRQDKRQAVPASTGRKRGGR